MAHDPETNSEHGATADEIDCTFSLDYAAIAKHFTGSVRHDVRSKFDTLTESAVLGEWCTVGAQKVRHWAPKGAAWDEERQWFVFGQLEEEELSPRAVRAHMASVSAREGALVPDERRRACKLWEKMEERFTSEEDARALAQALAGLTPEGKSVEVFCHQNGVKSSMVCYDGTKKEPQKRARAAAECDEGREEKRVVCDEDSPVRRLLEKEKVELLERKAKAESTQAEAKREAFPLTALEMVQKEYPQMDLREQLIRARQIVSFMTTGQVEAQAGDIRGRNHDLLVLLRSRVPRRNLTPPDPPPPRIEEMELEEEKELPPPPVHTPSALLLPGPPASLSAAPQNESLQDSRRELSHTDVIGLKTLEPVASGEVTKKSPGRKRGPNVHPLLKHFNHQCKVDGLLDGIWTKGLWECTLCDVVQPSLRARFANHCQMEGHRTRLTIASDIFETEMSDGSRDLDEVLADLPGCVDVMMDK
ncbi:hypothetical protein KFL_002740060 [Klebsormidium nitens]|uniref:Uncharacterized protein n=1 Tax=Klebsormidium nitens TaxID=105231 RepID=A0A1Y1IBR0_KLENI|nr:hypothetical protein KFL_002740060 [Klebsormidium nitens]|eukprot:GAQ86167.1 hypothetical protein KFL_002740060 [Klebsormidium nitens]